MTRSLKVTLERHTPDTFLSHLMFVNKLQSEFDNKNNYTTVCFENKRSTFNEFKYGPPAQHENENYGINHHHVGSKIEKPQLSVAGPSVVCGALDQTDMQCTARSVVGLPY